MTNAIFWGNPHVRVGVGDAASAKPRHGTSLCKRLVRAVAAVLTAGIAFASPTKVSILGDSYSTYAGTPGCGAAHYPNYIALEQSEQWWSLVLAETGASLEMNCSQNGSRMTGSDASSFIARAANLGSPDVIFVFGGMNDDWGGVSSETILTDVDALFDYLDEQHPTAKKYFVLNAQKCAYNKGLSAATRTALKQVCADHAYPVTDLDGVLGTSADDMAGTAYDHPTAAGFAKVAAAVLETLNEHSFVDPTPPTEAADTTGTVTETTIDGDVVYVFTSSGTFTPKQDFLVKEALVVGGGGAGGWTIGGGGGGGGVVRIPATDGVIIPSGVTCTVTVGAGGDNYGSGKAWVNGGDGGASSFTFGTYSVTALGGGGGAAWDTKVTVTTNGVASGGGACGSQIATASRTTGKGTVGQGHDGGLSNGQVPGGGGGYAEEGQRGTTRGSDIAGNGGAGVESKITGEPKVYGAGGGGGTGLGSKTPGEGGAETAGRGANASGGGRGGDGADGFGGGGGGGGYQNGNNMYNGGCAGGYGGSGTVILRLGLPSEKPDSEVKIEAADQSASAEVQILYVGAGATSCSVAYSYRLDLPGAGYSEPETVATGKVFGDEVAFTVSPLLPGHDYVLKTIVTNDKGKTTYQETAFRTAPVNPIDAEFTYSGRMERFTLGSEVVVKFLSSGTLSVTKPMCVSEALLVGGGGAGGWTIGGGGGGGGVVPLVQPGLIGVGEMSVTVGQGGTNYWRSGDANSYWKRGGNGGDTRITLGGTEYIAYGGGGGGSWGSGQNAGAAGASGGGNSGTTPGTPAACVEGQGNVGGKAHKDGVSGGGGGAGGPGTDAYIGEAAQSGIAGDGGDGVKSAITGEDVWYGGGGGAGAGIGNTSRGAPKGKEGKGGKGGGGNGADITSVYDFPQAAGTDGLGGGGGGGDFSPGHAGGPGGSGVVILRLVNGSLRLAFAAKCGDGLMLKFSRALVEDEAEIVMYSGATYGGRDATKWENSSVLGSFAEGDDSFAITTEALPAGAQYVQFACDGTWSAPLALAELEEVSDTPVISISSATLDGGMLNLVVSVDACGAGAESCDLFVRYGLSADAMTVEVPLVEGAPTGSANGALRGLLPARSYSYQVYAVNDAGKASQPTEVRNVTVAADVEPSDVPEDLPCLKNDARVSFSGGAYVEITGGILQGGTRPAKLLAVYSQQEDFSVAKTNEVVVDFDTDESYTAVLSGGLAPMTKHYYRLLVVDAETGAALDALPVGDFLTSQVVYTWRTTVAEGNYRDVASWTVDEGRDALDIPPATAMVIFPEGCTATVFVAAAETCDTVRFCEHTDVTIRGVATGAALDGKHDLTQAPYRRNHSLTLDNVSMSVPGECFFKASETWDWSGYRLTLTNGARFAPSGRFGQQHCSRTNPCVITVEKGSTFAGAGDWMSYSGAIVTLDNGTFSGSWILPGLDNTTSQGEQLVIRGTNSCFTVTGGNDFGSNTKADPSEMKTDIVLSPSGLFAQAPIRSTGGGKFGTVNQTIRFSVDPDAPIFEAVRKADLPVVSWAGGIRAEVIEFAPGRPKKGEASFEFTYPAGKTAEDGVNPTGIVLHTKRRRGFIMIVK